MGRTALDMWSRGVLWAAILVGGAGALSGSAGASAIRPRTGAVLHPFESVAQIKQTFSPYCSSVEVLSIDPLVVFLNDFVTDAQCDTLCDCAEAQGFMESTVRAGQEDGGSVRTSSTAWLNDAHPHSDEALRVLQMIDSKISRMTGQPIENLESLQVIKYKKDEQYAYHLDTIPEYNDLPFGGRLASCLIYLNDDFEGGATDFLELEHVCVQPRRGGVLFWYNPELPYEIEGDMVPDVRTTHAGLPVVSGTKYAANKWVHAKRYRFEVQDAPAAA
mmetsp:Transcript_78793/g.225570  ORF Transcript_78793/g.225570 Transcript_78793/m.225570 type:complete len:275 (-) Transcript_78793:281-1105(-)